MIVLISSETLAGIFYFLLFTFILALELLVVVSKTKDITCDYDLVVEHQLNVKRDVLNDLVKKQ